MSALKKISLLTIALALCSCASTPKNNLVTNVLIGVAAGYAIGSMNKNNSAAFGLLYGGMGGTAAALGTAYLTDFDRDNKRLSSENEKLRKDLEAITSPKTVYQSPAMFNSKVPDKYKRLIQPGEWRISEIDQWIEDSENRIIHQDKIMELIPPSLKTNN